MVFFGVEITADEITWIEGEPNAPIQLSHACLSKLGKKKDGRVVLEICADDKSDDDENDTRKTAQTATVGVLSASDGGADNIKLELVINSKMGLRLVGPGASGGAAVHLIGSLLDPVESDDEGGCCDHEGDHDHEHAHANGNGHDSDSSLDLEDPVVQQMLRDHGIDIDNLESDDDESDDDVDEGGDGAVENVVQEGMDVDGVEDESDDAIEPAYISKKARSKAEGVETTKDVPIGKSKAVVPKSQTSVITHKSGLRYQDLMVGAGKAAAKGKNVAINYTLRTESGKVVDKSGSKAFKFRLGIGEVIKGMDIGVLGMREGGERHLIVPANLGYGKEGSPPAIPRNATLFFDVALVRAW
jgi:FK506-binding nuclear protein